jgi:lysophospholipase L1-like esterase
MRSAAFSHVMSAINEVAKAEVGRHKIARFVDSWKLFSTASGAFDPRWRQTDGIHFNIDGQNRLATAVLNAVKADWRIQ